MKRKVGDRVIIKSKYFNPFNDFEGVITDIDFDYLKFTVKLDDDYGVDSLQVFDREELTKAR